MHNQREVILFLLQVLCEKGLVQQVGICSVASSHQKLNKREIKSLTWNFLIVGTLDFIVVLNQNLRNGAILIKSLKLHFSQDNFLIVVNNVNKSPLLVADTYKTLPQIEKTDVFGNQNLTGFNNVTTAIDLIVVNNYRYKPAPF